MHKKSGFKMMALALIIAIAGSLVVISNLHAGAREPGACSEGPPANVDYSDKSSTGTLVLKNTGDQGSFDDIIMFSFTGKKKNSPDILIMVEEPWEDINEASINGYIFGVDGACGSFCTSFQCFKIVAADNFQEIDHGCGREIKKATVALVQVCTGS